MHTVSQWWMWVAFLVFIACMLFADFFLFGGKKTHRVSTKEALTWTIVWISLSFLFNFLFWIYLNHTAGTAIANQKSIEFLTGYLIEKSLSVDNIFVILMIFNYFAIPAEYQRRVLMLGVIGAIVMRLILIVLGIWLVGKFAWILYIFGLFLLITGIKMFIFANRKPNLSENPVLKWMRNHLRITHELHKEHFYIFKKGLLYFTPLFLVLILVEVTDLIFSVDSIPAIFSVTNDPFIVFTSNIFAILGLRALYFLLANMNHQFHLLKYGLAFILVFVGIKMLIAHWIKISVLLGFSVVVFTLIISIALSVFQKEVRLKN
ncbi:MAG: hypothetical protein A3I77_00495 [Gammaproteobacteria bacterium RIFCSPLOWO2_02_FULL_42_14]|nr:MAG: hypothetical protein A3B71_08580 [Gammaproteobacteria bacterium RIFCSPHIGHO2_02_FULL_42_43]OGT29308.1 MAG: hypothetical protein A2624_04655 [Gammaproteobacteria bacterium RIFCSPHIGHO2_01_FULL_42_8]OGT50811.1 MAG: hypothetical protein A3E54_00775 [Gammaproteobacteria bacterium RIFCSPHIGHO2_12_FULL_41_25]OGT61794.1 MAG: hypothetical protein A3I77_00495 [Gammaproteobacteria bacterium RIFCSPLOWO2_02_FULL_42_14]OGT85538.1 MAG: hypothetical protein A3G86_06685 [Gammaproteobacteria bacterium R